MLHFFLFATYGYMILSGQSHSWMMTRIMFFFLKYKCSFTFPMMMAKVSHITWVIPDHVFLYETNINSIDLFWIYWKIWEKK